MYTSDQQILKLPDILIAKGIIDSPGQFYEETGIQKALFSNVKNQAKYNRSFHFTPEQIEKVCLMYGINFNWVFSTSDEVFNTKDKQKVNKLV
jgi:hypothetical protein